MKTISTAPSLQRINKLVNDYYMSDKQLIKSEKANEWFIQGTKQGKTYISDNARVILSRGKYKHVNIVL